MKKKVDYIKLDPAAAYNLAETMADILNNTIHNYWLSPRDAKTAIADCFKNLQQILTRVNAVAFRIFDGSLIVNGDPVHEKTHNIEVFVDHLESIQIDNFTFTSDIDLENFINFLEIIEAHKDEIDQLEGFATCLQRFKIKGVETKKLIFKEISDDEIIVDKDDLKGSSDGNASGNDAVGNILAFLKGDLPSDNPNTLKQLQETATDASQMADLILNAAEIRQQESPIEDVESMVDFVVGCLRRTYDGLTQQKSAKTKTGKKRITKNLLLLEKEVLDRMRAMSMEWNDDDLQAIVDATQEMTDELMIDSLADEYLATQKSSEEMEKQLLDYIKSVGIDNVDVLKRKFSEKGMDIGNWQELIVKSNSESGAGEGSGPGDGCDAAGHGEGPGGLGLGGGLGSGSGFAIGSLIEAISHLDVVMGNIEQDIESSDEQTRHSNCKKLVGALEEVTGQVKTMMTSTGHKIDCLVENLLADADAVQTVEEKAMKANTDIKLTRENILRILVEIVREISEPLAVIQTSLEMINSNTMGGLTDSQQKTLRLASENTEMISLLFRRLENISKA